MENGVFVRKLQHLTAD